MSSSWSNGTIAAGVCTLQSAKQVCKRGARSSKRGRGKRTAPEGDEAERDSGRSIGAEHLRRSPAALSTCLATWTVTACENVVVAAQPRQLPCARGNTARLCRTKHGQSGADHVADYDVNQGKVHAEVAHLSRGSSWTPADAAACGLSAVRLHRWIDRGCKLNTTDRSCKRTCTDQHPG